MEWSVRVPAEQIVSHNPNEIEFVKKYLEHNSIKYQEIQIPKCSFSRMNIKHRIDRIYRKMNCYIVQYVSDINAFCRINLPSKYYITSQYPLVENNLDITKCKQIIFDAGFLHYSIQNYMCKRNQGSPIQNRILSLLRILPDPN